MSSQSTALYENLKLSRWAAIRLLCYALLALVLVLCRQHYFWGTGLILLRWVLPVLGLLWWWRMRNRRMPVLLRVALVLVLVLSPAEWLYLKVQQERLAEGTQAGELRILTFNLYFKNSRPQATIAMIREQQPDILLLQEMTHIWKAALHPALLDEYPHFKLFPRRGAYGLALYSRHPIEEYQLLSLPKSPFYAQEATISFAGKRLRVYNAHLASPAIAVEHPAEFLGYYASNYALRKDQIEDIARKSAEGREEYALQVLGGDLNTSRLDPLYNRLSRQWVDSHAGLMVWAAPTFPHGTGPGPVLTLDYLMLKGAATVMSTQTIAVTGSDHCAVMGSFAL